MSLAYGITALAALCMVGVCVAADKKRDVWLLLVFVSVSVCDLGYFMTALSRDLGAALNSNRIAYLGSVFLPYFMLMMVLRFCGIRSGKRLAVVLAAVGIVILGITTSPGILPIYYSSVSIAIENGATRLVREYGPLHALYYVYLIGYLCAMAAVTIYAAAKGKIRSRVHTVLLLCAVLCNIVIWLAEQLLPRGFEWLSVSYILTECLILAIYRSMQRQGFMSREDRTQSYSINVLLAVYLLLFANTIRIVTRDTTPGMYILSHIVVLLIYIGILIFWSISVYDRIVNTRIRRHLIAIVALMVLWMLMRTLRFTVFLRVQPFGRWCWYAYYISIILVPQLCLFAAKHIGKPDSYRLPRRWYLMYVPSLALAAGILTNDLHQLAFRFHLGFEAGWDTYERSVLYYTAVVWVFSCIAVMIAEIVRSCRIPGTRRMIWLPIAMLGISVSYTLLYTINSHIFEFIEMSAALCFTVVAIWESSIGTGLIQSNSRYEELLRFSGLGVAVVGHDAAVHYRSDDALALTPEQIRQARKGPLILDGGIRISSSRIRGGYALRQEDLSGLIHILDELKVLREELRDSNAVSAQNYRMDKQIRILEEKNRLHDALYRQTAHQIDLLNEWLKRLIDTADAAQRKELLRRIVVVGAYLKRRNNLILVSEQDGFIAAAELELSVREMMKNMQLAGVACACTVQIDRDLPADTAMALFDFCEDVVEYAFDGLSGMLARFFRRGRRFYACVDAACSLDLTALESESISVCRTEENCYTLSFSAEGDDGP